MKKTPATKLTLDRNTLRLLSTSELRPIAGGNRLSGSPMCSGSSFQPNTCNTGDDA